MIRVDRSALSKHRNRRTGAGATSRLCKNDLEQRFVFLKGLYENHGRSTLLRMGQRRSNVRLLIKFLVLLAFFFVLFSVLFHVLMLHEGAATPG
ncbi:MAG: hypothetical protein R2861_12055 [Desulfobacterales bacterium]